MNTTETNIAQALKPIYAPRVIVGAELGALQRVITGAGLPTSQRYDGVFLNEGAARMQAVWMAAVEWACKAAAHQLAAQQAAAKAPAAPACTCIYATSVNTESVRKGYEMGGYLKEECDACKAEDAATPASTPEPSQQQQATDAIQFLKNVAADAVPMLSHDWPKTAELLKHAVAQIEASQQAEPEISPDADPDMCARRVKNFTVRAEPTREPDFKGEKSILLSYNGRQEYTTALAPHEARKVYDLIGSEFGFTATAQQAAAVAAPSDTNLASALRNLLTDCRAKIFDGDAARDAQELLDKIEDADEAAAATTSDADNTSQVDPSMALPHWPASNITMPGYLAEQAEKNARARVALEQLAIDDSEGGHHD